MEIDERWPKLSAPAREWLVANNGDAVSEVLLREIASVGGDAASGGWWVGDTGPEGFVLSDRAIDWIEAAGNGEHASDDRGR
ncbi:hypothetical protein IWX81_002832 [Salinibacterium sp. CAN_S4]|uniref:hypothetical protein n=1 Tax=Salinibacterium sp. CAN_S4 TaxID=2787727 RepID=UPI0018EFE40B